MENFTRKTINYMKFTFLIDWPTPIFILYWQFNYCFDDFFLCLRTVSNFLSTQLELNHYFFLFCISTYHFMSGLYVLLSVSLLIPSHIYILCAFLYLCIKITQYRCWIVRVSVLKYNWKQERGLKLIMYSHDDLIPPSAFIIFNDVGFL